MLPLKVDFQQYLCYNYKKQRDSIMDFYSMTLQALEEYFTKQGDNKAKARILYKTIYRNRQAVEEITDLSNKTKQSILDSFAFDLPRQVALQDDGETAKALLEFSDSSRVESVLMRHDYGAGLCISTQVGCSMGCAFCQSGKLKKHRNLTAGEMTAQVLFMQQHSEIKHISIMGIGEPLDNFDNLRDFLKILSNPYGLAFGGRNITISTCGIVPQIDRLTEIDCAFNLAVSLHAPTDDLRSQLMPINKRYGIADLISAVKSYSEKTARRIAFEYILLDGINDSREQAVQLASLLKDMNCYVNLIPYNATDCNRFKRSHNADIFFDTLKKQGINAIFRREFGGSIKAACGQLSAEYD